MATVIKGIAPEELSEIEEILRSTEFFYEFEIQTALEIADETLSKGTKSGYHWMKIRDANGIVAFANYGKNSFSTHSWDLYWIAVHQRARNKRLGSVLLKAVEDDVRSMEDGKILWIETSGRPLYSATEAFYIRNGYELQASLREFYGPGDPKQIYAKFLK